MHIYCRRFYEIWPTLTNKLCFFVVVYRKSTAASMDGALSSQRSSFDSNSMSNSQSAAASRRESAEKVLVSHSRAPRT